MAGDRSRLEPLDIVSIGHRRSASDWSLLPVGADEVEKRPVPLSRSWFEFTSSLPQRSPSIIVVEPSQSLIPACKAKPGFGVTVPESIERPSKSPMLRPFLKQASAESRSAGVIRSNPAVRKSIKASESQSLACSKIRRHQASPHASYFF